MKPDYIYLNTLQVSAEHDPFAADRYRQFARVLPEAARRVLDVGCSTGDGGKALKAIRPELALVALDCLQRRLDLLPAGIYADAKCSYSTDMGFEAGTFDAVVAGEFVQNLSYGDVLTSLAEFRRVLRPGGMLLMTTPFPDYLKRRLEGRPASGGPHLSIHYPRELATMMTEAGFKDVHWRGSGRISRVLGERFPVMSFYGSYLIAGIAAS